MDLHAVHSRALRWSYDCFDCSSISSFSLGHDMGLTGEGVLRLALVVLLVLVLVPCLGPGSHDRLAPHLDKMRELQEQPSSEHDRYALNILVSISAHSTHTAAYNSIGIFVLSVVFHLKYPAKEGRDGLHCPHRLSRSPSASNPTPHGHRRIAVIDPPQGAEIVPSDRRQMPQLHDLI